MGFCGGDNDENEEELREQRNVLRLEKAELRADLKALREAASKACRKYRGLDDDPNVSFRVVDEAVDELEAFLERGK